MNEAINTLAQRVKLWKELFIVSSGVEGLGGDSSWALIMEKSSINPCKLFELTQRATMEIGCFDLMERRLLDLLPWYADVVNLIPQIDVNMLDGTQFYIGLSEGIQNVCFVYQKKDLDIFDCYIVDPAISEIVKTDLLMSYVDIGRVACISFVEKIPENFKI